MAQYKILTPDRVATLVETLAPQFLGRQQTNLIAFADEIADQGYDQAAAQIEPLENFAADIQSPGGAAMIGLVDAGGYFGGVGNVEDALQSAGAQIVALGGGSGFAPINSPTFTGDPKAPTPATGDNDTSIATTAFVKNQGYTTNLGTVTSVAAANATGITWTGSPITGAGTLTPALSANLQAWHALAPSAKQDASANLTSWSAIAPSAKQDASANLTSWSAISPSSKADDTAVVKLAGAQNLTGNKNFGAGLNFGSAVAPGGILDVSRHIDLYGTVFGLNITSSAMNINAPTGSGIYLNANGFSSQGTGVNGAGTMIYGGIEVGYRDLPRTTGGLSRGAMFATASGVTVNTGFAAGSTYHVYNDSGAAISIIQGAGMTLRKAGTATTGTLSLAQRGFCTIWHNSTTEAIVSGDVT